MTIYIILCFVNYKLYQWGINMSEQKVSKNILSLSHYKARAFFLRSYSYLTLQLPSYYNFSNILKQTHKELQSISDFKSIATNCRNIEHVNHYIYDNKDSKYGWRKFTLINPALYVNLIHEITKQENWDFIKTRFEDLRDNSDQIECCSIPVFTVLKKKKPYYNTAQQILHWWDKIEQKSITQSLNFSNIIHVDIANFYDSIYTHSIAWALHTKATAKNDKDKKKLFGSIIDTKIQDMSNGQTNGIPTGSVVMDLISEMILAYADSELSQKLKSNSIAGYKILRYRDDYRIFCNNETQGIEIVKILSQILLDLGLKLNSQKTIISNDIITSSVKKDKLALNQTKLYHKNLQKYLLSIRDFSILYSNSGSLIKILLEFTEELEKTKKQKLENTNIDVLLTITIDIMIKNPKTTHLCITIISILLSKMNSNVKIEKIKEIYEYLTKILSHSNYTEIWFSRLFANIRDTLGNDIGITSSEKLCDFDFNNNTVSLNNDLWDNSFITKKALRKILDNKSIIIDQNEYRNVKPIMESSENKYI